MMQVPNSCTAAEKCETPIVDFLLQNAKSLSANYHAMPIYNADSKVKDYEKFINIFGSNYLSLETTVTGRVFDSFFYPTKCIKKAQNYAANVFGSKDTLFLTCGSSISNQIVVDALVDEQSNVLLDRESHQSMHFSVSNKTSNLDYFYSKIFCPLTERKYIKIDSLFRKIKESIKSNRPYDVIIINSASYDGIVCNIYEIIKDIACILPNAKFIIDEAWTSAFYFHPDLYMYTAGYAARKLKFNTNIVSVQSAHKSLMSLRQASLIHSFASNNITEKLYKSRFKYHSTSPSYPILASIDMARAQMQIHGRELVETALKNAKYLRQLLNSDTNLKKFLPSSLDKSLYAISRGLFVEDPLKIHLNFSHLGISGIELQDTLYHLYGIYLNRYTESTALINVHIGINHKQIEHLIKSLKVITRKIKLNKINNIKDDNYIITYPPGIPLYVPGENLDHTKVSLEIKEKIKCGINVFQVR